jgi:hypothetical protein
MFTPDDAIGRDGKKHLRVTVTARTRYLTDPNLRIHAEIVRLLRSCQLTTAAQRAAGTARAQRGQPRALRPGPRYRDIARRAKFIV